MRGWRNEGAESLDDAVRHRYTRVVGIADAGPDLDPDWNADAGSDGDVRQESDSSLSGHLTATRALAALDPGRRGVRALAAIAVLVVCIAAFLAWRARPQPTPMPDTLVSRAADPQPGPASGSAATVVVAVAGRVHRPGLVRLSNGARVADAIEAAGGALPGTDLSYVNLARKVIDGELILVGVTAPPGAGVNNGGAAGAAHAPLNLNLATLAELETLPGVGAVLGQNIIDYRTKHGGFRSVAELRQVDGIGDARYAQLKDLVTV